MYLHLGKDTVVENSKIVALFDIDKTTVGKITREYLSGCEKRHEIINVSDELPKSFIVCNDNDVNVVYISQLSAATLLKRSKSILGL